MKKVFIKSLVICVVCFMCAGISRIVFGEKNRSSAETVAASSYDEPTAEYEYYNDDVYQSASWNFSPAAYLSLNTSGANTEVVPADREDIGLDIIIPEGEHIFLRAYEEDEQLSIEIRPDNVTFFGDVEFGTVDWLEDIFHGTSNIKAVISMPMTIYESLECRLGSGQLTLKEPTARRYDIEIGSGNFQMIGNCDFSAYNCDIDLNSGSASISDVKSEAYDIEVNSGDFRMDGDENFTAAMYDVELNSGKAVITNMTTAAYNLEIGSGRFDYSGLSGSGTINMGSGKGALAYSDCNGDNELEMGSGTVDIYLPERGAIISADIGSGSVTVDGFGMNQKISDGDEIRVGSGEYVYAVDIGSGKVKFKELKDYTVPEETDAISEVTDESEFTVTKDESSPEAAVVDSITEDSSVVGVEEVPGEPAETRETQEISDIPEFIAENDEVGVTENADNAA